MTLSGGVLNIMDTYLFKTDVTMHKHNSGYWIDNSYVEPIKVTASSLQEAISKYCEILNDEYSIIISKTAQRNPDIMYRNAKSGEPYDSGLIFVAKTDFYDDRRRGWTQQYIDVWAEIDIISKPTFNIGKRY